jgi:hypothetical protein
MRPRFSAPGLRRALLSSLALLLLPGAGLAVTGAPGWIVGSVPLPGTNASDLAAAGSSFVVGIGSYGVATESIVRIERDGTVTTLVTGLNSIGGITFDRDGDRLLFTDNGLEAPPGTATTGDTLYALLDPLGAAGPVAASTLELAPSGSVNFAQAVLAVPGGDVLVGEAAGFGAGRVVKLSGGVLTDLVTGLDYTAGMSLSLTPAGELLVGDVDSGTFLGSVLRYDLSGAFLGALVGGLSGTYDQSVDADGHLLLTGGFTGDFSSSTVVRIAPGGAVAEIASGFGFSSGIDIDGPSQQALVLDFGTSRIDTLTPVAALTPGGRSRRDCQVEVWGGAFDRKGNGDPTKKWTCSDGSDCDRDGEVNGACELVVGACFSVTDARLPLCTPASVDEAIVKLAKAPAVAAALQSAVDAVLPSASSACSAAVEIAVPVNQRRKAIVRARRGGSTLDSDGVTLRCTPAV